METNKAVDEHKVKHNSNHLASVIFVEGSLGCPIKTDCWKPGKTLGAMDRDHHANLPYADAKEFTSTAEKTKREVFPYVTICGGYTIHAESDGEV